MNEDLLLRYFRSIDITICYSCKHFEEDLKFKVHRCKKRTKESSQINAGLYLTCRTMRECTELCNPKAKYYEPKE